MPLMRDGNLWLGVAGVCLSGLYLWFAQSIAELPYGQGLGPRALPLGLGVIFLLLSIAMILTERAPVERPARSGPFRSGPRVFGMIAVAGIYALLLPWFGYVATALVVYAALMLISGQGWRRAGMTAVVMVAMFYFIFDWFLAIPFPRPAIVDLIHA